MTAATPFSTRTRSVILGSLLAALGATAGAGTLSMQGWYFGHGNKVTVNSPNYNGQAGGFRARLSGLSNPLFNLADIEMYCVDIAQTINVAAGTNYSVKMAGEAGSATFVIKPIEQVFDAARVDRLERLVSFAEDSALRVANAAQSTSMQLAIWNILYDQDNSLFGYQGAAFSDSSSHRGLASDLLSQSLSQRVNRQLYVMSSATRQDQLFWLDARQVPEPGALALVGAALGAFGLAQRRARRG